MKEPCTCMECRIRAACAETDGPDGGFFECDFSEAIIALSSVMTEMLAHYSTTTVEMVASSIVAAATRGRCDPWVLAQQTPAGHA